MDQQHTGADWCIGIKLVNCARQTRMRNAKTLAMEHNWTEIDVTGRAVEETASLISELLNERFPDDEVISGDNNSIL